MTPAMAEVLGPLPPLPYDDDFVNAQAKTLEKVLGEIKAPVRVIGHVRLPSHTLLVVQPGHTGRLGNRRQVTPEDVKAALSQVGVALEAEVIDVIVSVEGAPGAFGVLVRNAKHRPLVLRSLLMQPGFQQAAPRTSLVFGLDLIQSVVVDDLVALAHLLVLGGSAARVHFLHTSLATLMLFNTPAELRLTLASKEPQHFRAFASALHLTGPILGSAEDARKMLEEIDAELEQRKGLFEQKRATDLDAYNSQADNSDETPLPRRVVLLDCLLDGVSGEPLARLVKQGPRVGVHLIGVTENADLLPADVRDSFGAQLVLRGAAAELKGLPLQGLPMRFVDALYLKGEDATPLELCIAPAEEVAAIVAYWVRAGQQREAQRSAPPAEAAASPGPPPTRSETFIAMEVGEAQPPPLMEAAQTMETILPRARALAAYLGWLSAGPLREVLGLTEKQAASVMDQLRAEGLLEPKVAPTLRYRRLDTPPGE
ncbi:MAG: hypothetical protein Kow00120_24270 [Anaerolineae bacterium]